MASDELLVTLGLNASDFESGLKNAKNELKRMESELKTTEKSLGGFENTTEGLGKKIKSLENILKSQRNVTDQYKTSIKEVEERLKNQVTAHDNLKNKLTETKNKLSAAKSEFGENSEEVKKLEKEVKNLTTQFNKSESGINKTVNNLKDLESQCRQSETKTEGLENEIKDLQTRVNNFNTNKMESELKDVEDASKKAGDKLKDIGGKLTTSGAVLSASVTAPLGLLGKKLLDLGSESQEMQNKFDIVFKDTAGTVEQWATDLSNAIGRSRHELKTAVSDQADLMIGMGMTEGAAFDLSSKFIELAYDLASFNNTSDEYALEAMSKAMLGETEMAKMLGVNLSATKMETSKFTKATGKSWQQLTQAEKAQVYYLEALEQSPNAFGDAARSSDGYANQVKALQGKLTDLGTNMGQILIPFATKVVGIMIKLTEKFGGLSTEVQTALIIFGGIAMIIPPIIIILGTLITACGTIAGIFAGISAATIGVIAGIGAVVLALATCKDSFLEYLPSVENIKSALENFSNSMMNGFNTLGGVVVGIWTSLLKPTFESVANIVGIVVSTVIDLLPTIGDIFNTTCEIIKVIYDTVLKPVFDFIVQIIQDCVNLFAYCFPIMSEIVKSAWDSIKKLWESVLKPTFTIIAPIVQGVINSIRPMWATFCNIIKSAFDIVKNVWQGVLKPVFDLIVSVIGWVVQMIAPHMSKFQSCITNAMNFVLSPIRLVIDTFNKLGDVVSNVTGWVADKVSWIGGLFGGKSITVEGQYQEPKNAPKFGSFMGISQDLQNGIATADYNVDSGIYTPTSTLSRSLTDMKDDSNNKLLKSMDSLVNMMKSTRETAEGGITLNIDNFNNNREMDIKTLMQELEFYRKKSMLRGAY